MLEGRLSSRFGCYVKLARTSVEIVCVDYAIAPKEFGIFARVENWIGLRN
jgi:hypothetical protein